MSHSEQNQLLAMLPTPVSEQCLQAPPPPPISFFFLITTASPEGGLCMWIPWREGPLKTPPTPPLRAPPARRPPGGRLRTGTRARDSRMGG